MPTNPQTQALLDEVKAPTRAKRPDVEAKILDFLPTVAAAGEQGGRTLTLAQLAEIAEEDPELRARLPLYAQTGGALRRIATEAEAKLMELIQALRQMERYDADVRPQAKAKGYAP